MPTPDLTHSPLSDAALLDEVTRLAAAGRRATSELVAVLVALDARRLYLAEGYQSLFDFCQRRLRLSESEAYHRIEAARTARLFPSILERLRAGALTLTNVALLRPHLTESNHEQVLAWAEGRSKREVEVFVRTLDPRPDVGTSIRRLAEPRPRAAGGTGGIAAVTPGSGAVEAIGGETLEGLAAGPQADARRDAPGLHWNSAYEGEPATAPPRVAGTGARPCAPPPRRPAEIRPLAPARYSLHVTISEATRTKLRRAQALLWHAEPDADEALVLDRALTLLVETLERRKFGALKPRPVRGKSSAGGASHRRSPAARRPAEARVEHRGERSGPRNEAVEAADAERARADLLAGRREPAGSGTVLAAATVNAGGAGRAAVMPEESAAASQPARAADDTQTFHGARAGSRSSGPRTPTMPARARAVAARRSRSIPAAVRREVWLRDGGACAYLGPAGRCGQTAGVEFHHHLPVADGGASTVANLSLRCARHHAIESARWFGEAEERPLKTSSAPALYRSEVA